MAELAMVKSTKSVNFTSITIWTCIHLDVFPLARKWSQLFDCSFNNGGVYYQNRLLSSTGNNHAINVMISWRELHGESLNHYD